MLFVKNLMFLNAATATLAPDLDLLGEIAHVHTYFLQVHGERLVRELGMDPTQATVDVDAVKALQRAILARGVNGGILLTVGRIGREAGKAAASSRIQMIDGVALKALIAPVRRATPSSPAVDETMADTVPARDAHRTIPTSPKCPLCTKPMRLRTARRGRHAGHGFWSCIDHPHCKGLRALTGRGTAA